MSAAETEVGDSNGWDLALLVLLLPLSVWHAFVVAKLWGWFAVPLGAPMVTLAQFGGLSALWTAVKFNAKKSGVLSKDCVLYGITIPLICLGLGAFFHSGWMQ